jgi:hypothetical protein
MRSIMTNTLAAALFAATLGMTTQVASADTKKLTITAAGAINNATPTSPTGTAYVLISVTDPDGNPVTDIASMLVNDFVTPPSAPCGFVSTGFNQIKPGFYQISLNMPNGTNCAWVSGDYLGVVRIYTNQLGGMAPFKITSDSKFVPQY